MTNGQWQRAKAVFEQALEMNESQQMAFVHQICGDDQSLLAEVKKMIVADRQGNSLLDLPLFHWSIMTQATHDDRQDDLPFNFISHYRLIRRLGRPSGMGEVFLAEDGRENMKRPVAIKLMSEKLPPQYLARFNEEVQILAKLNHPNITTLYDSGQVNEQPFLVMEYCDGESLQDRLDRGPLPLSEVVAITNQICEALYEAQSKGIVHRDIKPANIMVRQTGSSVMAKLLDFGIAILEGAETKTILSNPTQKPLIGTAAYISPEQAEGKNRHEIDHRADIYSLGAVVYQMLTGVMVFNGRTIDDFLHQHRHVRPVPPSKRKPELKLSPAIDAVIMKALKKKPEDRFQLSRDFANELAQAAAHKPQSKAWKRVALPLAAALAVVLGSMWGYQQLHRTPGNEVVNNLNGPSQSTPPSSTQIGPVNHGNSGGTTTPEMPAASPAPPSTTLAIRPSLSIEVLKRIPGGEAREVTSEPRFQTDDYVRFEVIPSQEGYLYLLQRGTDGKIEILYPRKEMKTSFVATKPSQKIEIPQPKVWMDWFQLRGKPGTEEVFFVWANQKGEPALADLEKAIENRQTGFAAGRGAKTLAKLEAYASGQESSLSLVVKKQELNHLK